MLALHSAALLAIAKAYRTKEIEISKLSNRPLLQLSDELPKRTHDLRAQYLALAEQHLAELLPKNTVAALTGDNQPTIL
jgi:predicted HTH domain antitoxin